MGGYGMAACGALSRRSHNERLETLSALRGSRTRLDRGDWGTSGHSGHTRASFIGGPIEFLGIAGGLCAENDKSA
jgi:hypothetical protein